MQPIDTQAKVEDAAKLAELASKLIDYPEVHHLCDVLRARSFTLTHTQQLFNETRTIVYEGDIIRRTRKKNKVKGGDSEQIQNRI